MIVSGTYFPELSQAYVEIILIPNTQGGMALDMLEVGAIGDAAIVRITEEIDFVSAPRLEHVLKVVERTSSGRIVLSLESCPYCDSTCIGIVLRAVNRIGSRLAVVVPPNTIQHRVFEITGLVGQPFIFDTLDDALAAPI